MRRAWLALAFARSTLRARWRTALLSLLGIGLLPWVGLVVAACFCRLPPTLSEPGRTTVLVLDRQGRLLREVAVGQGAPSQPVVLDELSPWIVPALLAAEDSRYFSHPGVDPLAVMRALVQLCVERRVVSGASTLTQQLARTVEHRPRSVAGKLREMALALRIEASLSKRQILEQYLSRVEFGPNLVGIEAASRHYFQKSAARLDLAEAAALVSLPRGPSLYDPERRPQLLERRRLRVLGRLGALGRASSKELVRAELTPVRVTPSSLLRGAEHLSFALAQRDALGSTERARSLTTTLDGELQREAEQIAVAALPALERHGGGALSLVVVDNASGDVLAYVGSPDYFDTPRLGANDGVAARRQPGSALKPFVYAAAVQELGYHAASLLPDLPRQFMVPGGSFSPRNYDQRFRGPVLLRQALGSSLNVPALELSSRLGPPRLLAALHRFGFASLDREAEHYGVGLALGDGEVTLLELAAGYAALARGGETLAPRFVLTRTTPGAREHRFDSGTRQRVLRRDVAALISDILADDAARAAGFGRDSVLTFPFAVAAKTGTSKGFRDNWALGYTREVTVGVWVGNFDGAPLRDASGITAAGPVFHQLMLAAMRGRSALPLFDSSLLLDAEICPLSGQRPGPACSHRRLERFLPGTVPTSTCDMHVEAHVDSQGRETHARCSTSRRLLERYPEPYMGWARQAGRPLAGVTLSPTCPPDIHAEAPLITFPRDDQSFTLDPDGPSRQEILFTASSSASSLRFVIDGRRTAAISPPFQLPWQLTPGTHTLRVETNGARSSPITFRVSPLTTDN
jgi:penicillin-binding protein 1C